MTCIVGLEAGGKVWMGADGLSVKPESWGKMCLVEPKVFHLSGLVIGCAGMPRLVQILKYALTVPEIPEGKAVQAWMATDFADAVRETLRKCGWMRQKEGADEGGHFLVGCRGELYLVESDFVALRPARGFEALGSGDSYALGAMEVTREKTPAERITGALAAAAALNASVGPPFTILCEGEDA